MKFSAPTDHEQPQILTVADRTRAHVNLSNELAVLVRRETRESHLGGLALGDGCGRARLMRAPLRFGSVCVGEIAAKRLRAFR